MPRRVKGPTRVGPLAELALLCDRMDALLGPGRRWYPEVEARLRALDYAIEWEMRRFEWEVAESAGRREKQRVARAVIRAGTGAPP